QNHVGLHDEAAVGIGGAHHRTLLHRRMFQEHGLHLGTGDVVAGRDDHVVGPRLEPVVAVLVSDVGVAGQVPSGLGVGGLALRVAHVAAAGGTAHGEPSGGARRHLVAGLVHHLCFV